MSTQILNDFDTYLANYYNTPGSVEKYITIIQNLQQILSPDAPEDFYYDESLTNWERKLQTIEQTKEQQKALIYYRSFVLLNAINQDKWGADYEKELELNKDVFYNVLLRRYQFSIGTGKKHLKALNSINEKLKEANLALLTGPCTLSNLRARLQHIQIGMNLNKDEQDLIPYYASYAVSSLIQDTAATVSEPTPQVSAYEYWCIQNELAKPPTIQKIVNFVDTLSEKAVSYGYKDFNNGTPEENLAAILHLQTTIEEYESFFVSLDSCKYTEYYGHFLMEQLGEVDVLSLPYRPAPDTERPVLFMGEGKKLAATFKDWLSENFSHAPQSLRTFVSSLNSADQISTKELDFGLYDLTSARQAAYARLHIIKDDDNRKLYGRVLTNYILFLCHYRLVDKETCEQDTEKILEIIDATENGHWRTGDNAQYTRLTEAWQQWYGSKLLYDKAAVDTMLSKVMVPSDTDSGLLISPGQLLPEERLSRINQFIADGFACGCPAIDYVQILGHIEQEEHSVIPQLNKETLATGLRLREHNRYKFTREYLYSASEESKVTTENILDYVIATLKRLNKPVNIEEWADALPYLDKDRIKDALNRYGWKRGIINPRLEKIFHADYAGITEAEMIKVALIIHEYLQETPYLSSSILYELLKDKMPEFYENREFLSVSSLYAILRYRLSSIFQMDKSFICKEDTTNTPDRFSQFCKENPYCTIEQLKNLEAELGKTTIPFYTIWQICIRITDEDFIPKENITFDVDSIDAALEKLVTSEFTLLSDVMQHWPFDSICGYPWTDHIMLHYLHFISKRYTIIIRNFKKENCANGYIVKKSDELKSFDEMTAAYLAKLPQLSESREEILDLLLRTGLISTRRYDSLDSILCAARLLRG